MRDFVSSYAITPFADSSLPPLGVTFEPTGTSTTTFMITLRSMWAWFQTSGNRGAGHRYIYPTHKTGSAVEPNLTIGPVGR